MKIDWEWIIRACNEETGTNYRTVAEMLEDLYNKTLVIAKVSALLGLATPSVHDKMRELGIPRLPKGHRGQSKYQQRYRQIPNVEQYCPADIAEIVGCSYGYVYFLKKSVEKWEKKGVKTI